MISIVGKTWRLPLERRRLAQSISHLNRRDETVITGLILYLTHIMTAMYSANKVAQMAAFFGVKQGGIIKVLKLTKLLYLADRESLARYGWPITYDKMVSMDHGPVLSKTLNLTNGLAPERAAAQWEEWISSRSQYDVEVKRKFERDDLDELSDADLEILESVWHKFGSMDRWTLRDWTHDNCPEWKDPNGSSSPIDEVEILEALGNSKENAKRLAENIKAEREIDDLFARL